MKVCNVEGCNRDYCAKGYCRKHYYSVRFKALTEGEGPKCIIDGCENRSYRKGMCNKHYQASVYDKSDKKKWNKRYSETEKGKRAIKKGNHAYRARKKKVLVESFSPLDVYERDYYICCVCGLPINPRDKKPNLHSVSLEHKIPLSKGGEHSFNNCAPSHLICNLRKNNKIVQPSFEGASI